MYKLITNDRTATDVSMFPVYILSLATFIVFFQGFMVAPLLPLLSEQFGTTTRHVSFIEPSYLLGYGLFTLVYAPLSDRFGRFRIIALCLIIFSVLTLLTAYAHGINQMIFLRLLTGIGAAGIAPTTISWISDRYPYEKRGHALGIFFGNMAGGTAFGSSAGALITSLVGWQWLFIGVASIALLILLLIVMYQKDIFKANETVRGVKENIFLVFCNILSSGRARHTYFYVLFNGMFHGGIFAWLAYFFYRNYGLDELQIGLALLGYGIPGLLLGPLLGKLVDHYGRQRIIPLGLFLGALTVLLLSQNLNLAASCVLVALLSLGFDLSHPLFAAIVTTFSAQKGAATGLFAFFLFSGYGLGSLLLSLIVNIGLESAFQVFGGCLLLAAICSIFVFRKEK
ncbi:MFS transporter [Sphingobacterium paramultivorum]|uniref:MFS transporter n=1 Tax=Sphingobacterium paramultivorum TaxID=2886510 RepID=A0A7G5E1Y1_9SPHI|nr:MFS transporter [Sphingobacterium paramultivorum]QMV68006.1 MFS transporter [Sphingobacterium paramultivorum]WSO16906.1 MFS transporter [Sphingobacterium paramultivorum]